MKEFDNTERLLIDTLKEIKIMFELTECNKTAAGYLDSYNIIKKKLKDHNPNLVIKEIYKK